MTKLREARGSFAFTLTPARGSKLLGKRFTFERSTALGLSPDTLLRALVGFDLAQLIEKTDYSLFLALRALGRSEEAGSQLQQGTLGVLSKGMGTPGQPGSIEELRGVPNGLSTPWRILLRSLRPALPRRERRTLARLAYFDRVAHQISNAQNPDLERERRRRVFLPSLTYWHETGLGLTGESMLILDATLCHLACLELDIALTTPDATYPFSIVGLAEPAKRPMRHWFDELLAETKCANLVDLHNLLAKRGRARHGRPITHDILKKWASTERLMPHEAGGQLLGACADEAFRGRARTRLCLARLLTVLVELVASFASKPIEPKAAQSAIHKRLQTLRSELQASSGSGLLFLV